MNVSMLVPSELILLNAMLASACHLLGGPSAASGFRRRCSWLSVDLLRAFWYNSNVKNPL
jgi:hypothetical protein